MLHLKIITPRKVVLDEEVNSVSVPSSEGEITILSHHENLFSLLVEGIIKIIKGEAENYLSIGGGYIETDGETVMILVSKAYGQSEIDKGLTEKALDEARKILSEAKDEKQRSEALAMMRRAIIDTKLLKKRKAPRSMV
ncbi:ATP synthase F1 subunit epsilon [Candidatus Roizmanbacteria bacterium]|nr:ATP synthase F1 subunit epsilon [Candidatus Roizmanbacteria bacterium]